MLVQVDLENRYCVAYDIIARSHGMSRRQYITEFLMRAAEKVPGLMDRVRADMSGEPIEQESDAEVRPYKNILELPDPPQRMKRYRFTYRDESLGFVEGVGKSAGPALQDATGRKWPWAEFEPTFLEPEFLGYVDEEV